MTFNRSVNEPSGRAASAGLSTPESQLEAAARKSLPAAASLLFHFQAPFMTIATKRCSRVARTELLLWSEALEPRTVIGATHGLCASLADRIAMLLKNGGVINGMLADRWPPNAVPTEIGVITDGTGMAVSAYHPSGRTRDMILDHAAGLAPATILVPFAPDSAWALLGPATSSKLH